MNYWQMTLAELTQDSFEPIIHSMHMGSWSYECPICSAVVGIRTATDGFVYKREACKNGHVVKWSE